ncbi:unnamed protein product, partial [Acanthoscelides obtectus]
YPEILKQSQKVQKILSNISLSTASVLQCDGIVSRDSHSLVSAHFRLDHHRRVARLREVVARDRYLYLVFPPAHGDLHSYLYLLFVLHWLRERKKTPTFIIQAQPTDCDQR